MALTSAWLVLVPAGTLLPSKGQDSGTLQTGLLRGELGFSQVFGNIIPFALLGAALYLAELSARSTGALGLAVSGGMC